MSINGGPTSAKEAISKIPIPKMPMDVDYDPETENQAAFRLALYVLWFVSVSAVLLAINTWMIFSLTQGTAKIVPQFLGIEILVQLLIFIGPMVLLYLEWFAWDLIYAHRTRSRINRRSNQGS